MTPDPIILFGMNILGISGSLRKKSFNTSLLRSALDVTPAIMGVSGAMSGTMRGQYHLRQVLAGVDALVVTRPEVFVRNGAEKFDANGVLTDDQTRDFVRKLVEALVNWANLPTYAHRPCPVLWTRLTWQVYKARPALRTVNCL